MKGKSLFTALVTLTLILMFGTMVPKTFAATYYYVGKSGEYPYTTISDAFTTLKSNVGGTLVGKGEFIIQVQDTATYTETVTLDGLTTTSVDILTLRKNPSLSGRPTIDATSQPGPAINITTIAYLTIEGFILKANQTLYRILWANQTGLTDGLLTVRNNVFDGQGVGNDQGNQCAQLQVMPMRIDTIISGNEFKNGYDDDDSCPLLTVYTDTSGGEPVSEPEVVISDNVFHDNRVNVVIYNSDDYSHTGIIERNRIYNNRCPSTSPRSWGGIIAFDYNDGLMVVRNNLIYNNDWSYLSGRAAIYCLNSDNKKIYNNTLYKNNASGGEIHVDANSNVGVEVKNNIIQPNPNGKYCIYLDAGAEAGLTSATNLFYADFDNNGIYDSTKDYVAYKKTGPGKKQFIRYLIAGWNSTYEVVPDYSIYETPNFASTNPDEANFLHITSSGSCVDRGVYVAEVTDDIDGDVRSGSYDIGADEFVIDTTPPAAVIDLTTSNPTVSSIDLTWTAPGDNDITGTASRYDIRYLPLPITEENWEAASQCANEPWPSPAGTVESFTVTGLSPNTTYYFALKTADEAPNWSGLSNSPSGTTKEGVAQKMHVSAIDMSLKTKGSNVNAIATVTIVDANNAPVSSATVSGHWSGATTDTDSGVTDDSGKVSLQSNVVKNPAPSTTFTFTVDNVVKAGWTYDPGANVETYDSISTPPAAPADAYTTSLKNAYPSPGNPETWIPFTLSKTEHVVIKIYNATGRLVRALDLGNKPAGVYLSKDKAAYWDGKNGSGEKVSSGVYFYLMEAGSFRATKKMLIIR